MGRLRPFPLFSSGTFLRTPSALRVLRSPRAVAPRNCCWFGSVAPPPRELAAIKELEQKIIWLSTYTIHNANNIRPSRDGIKVGGHQASSASMATILAALYFKVLQPHDRVAVKPHASPIFHAIQYLLGNQSQEQLERFRSFGGIQSYPSVTKDQKSAQVDFSTGSVGLGSAVTTFAALVQEYLHVKGQAPKLDAAVQSDRPGRMIAIVGDAELDEGNVYEALMESWKQNIKNNWWIIDYNRQSLDRAVFDDTFRQVDRMFRANGWEVITLKYGKKQLAAFKQPGGVGLKKWINSCDNNRFSAFTFTGGASFRKAIVAEAEPETVALVEQWGDDELFEVMTNLGGHCLETLLEAFDFADNEKRSCFIAYTIKGFGLPMAGHRDNHGLFLQSEQIAQLQREHGVAPGEEWAPLAGIADTEAVEAVLQACPFASIRERDLFDTEEKLTVPEIAWAPKAGEAVSTQTAFGMVMAELAKGKSALSDRLLTTSPDVATSTNLTGFINRRGVFAEKKETDGFKQADKGAMSLSKWDVSPSGQHVELGIAENNLFLMLAAAGLSRRIFGRTLLPVGTLYDPFIARGLDAMNYAVYQDARFMLVATPSGITLAPEGGAHQSINSPLIGMGQPGLVSWEPTYADELALLMRWSFDYMQEPGARGGSVYFRLSTRNIEQVTREITPEVEYGLLRGGYWHGPQPTASTQLVIAYAGVMAPEVLAAAAVLRQKLGGSGGIDESVCTTLQVSSADLLHNEWHDAKLGKGGVVHPGPAHVHGLLKDLPQSARIVTVCDAHPATLAWLGAVNGHRVRSLGVNQFGQSGDTVDLYEHYQIDERAIVHAAQSLLTEA